MHRAVTGPQSGDPSAPELLRPPGHQALELVAYEHECAEKLSYAVRHKNILRSFLKALVLPTVECALKLLDIRSGLSHERRMGRGADGHARMEALARERLGGKPLDQPKEFLDGAAH